MSKCKSKDVCKSLAICIFLTTITNDLTTRTKPPCDDQTKQQFKIALMAKQYFILEQTQWCASCINNYESLKDELNCKNRIAYFDSKCSAGLPALDLGCVIVYTHPVGVITVQGFSKVAARNRCGTTNGVRPISDGCHNGSWRKALLAASRILIT